MPTLSSRPSDDALDEITKRETSTATTTTPTPISSPYRVISSENIASFGKPNAIVRPLRRSDSQERNPAGIGGYTNGSLENIDAQVMQNFGIISSSQQNAHMDNLNNNNNNNEKTDKIDVTKEFDLKLKKFNRDTPKSSSKNVNLYLICLHAKCVLCMCLFICETRF